MSAPLVIRTGLPGNSKTLNAIKELDTKAKAEGRVVYYHNIRGLKPERLQADWFEFDDARKWHELPHNSIIVVDEAQGSIEVPMFGSRDPRAPVPPHISALETIRHGGYELNLITQDPRFIDVHARRLCNRHIHYWRIFGSNKISRYETPRVVNDVDKLTSFAQSSREIITLDSKYFGVYESSKGDHHFKFRPSRKAVLSVAVIVIAVVGVWSMMSKFAGGGDAEPDSATIAEQVKGVAGSVIPGFADKTGAAVGGRGTPVTRAQYMDGRVPRLANVPSSAPIYDALTEAVAYPKMYCVSSTDDAIYAREFQRMASAVVNGRPTVCQCYTQQATRIATDFAFCMNSVEYGYFDPAIADRGAARKDGAANPGPSVARSEPSSVVAPAQTITVVGSGKPGLLW